MRADRRKLLQRVVDGEQKPDIARILLKCLQHRFDAAAVSDFLNTHFVYRHGAKTFRGIADHLAELDVLLDACHKLGGRQTRH